MSLSDFLTDGGRQFTNPDVDSPGVEYSQMFELGQHKIIVRPVVLYQGIEAMNFLKFPTVAIDMFQ